MSWRIDSALAVAGTIVLVASFGGRSVYAENIDPNNNGSQYAYAENVGWWNAEPLGNGGPGVTVGTSSLSGWIWGENIGWISLNCSNTNSCATVSFGVVNDGCGGLSGYAWAENVGWINFAPSTAGVSIDLNTGVFSGRAWGENIGWITFSATSPVSYRTATSWRRQVVCQTSFCSSVVGTRCVNTGLGPGCCCAYQAQEDDTCQGSGQPPQNVCSGSCN